MSLTLNGAKKTIEALNGHSKPPDQAEVKKRVASRARQLEVWSAMVAWFNGDHSPKIHSKLIWEPACTLGPLLPQPPPHRRGIDNPIESQCRSEHWKSRIRLSLGWIIQDWLEEGIPAEELKKPRYLKVALEEAGRMVTLEQWGPTLEAHHEYYKIYPGGEVEEAWIINYGTYRLHVKRYASGKITKNKNNEEDVNSPNFKPPSSRPLLETEISQDELSKIIKELM